MNFEEKEKKACKTAKNVYYFELVEDLVFPERDGVTARCVARSGKTPQAPKGLNGYDK